MEHALGIGGGGGAESEVGGADEEEAEKDIGRLRAENAKLRQQLEAQAQRMAKLERISQLQGIVKRKPRRATKCGWDETKAEVRPAGQ